jgi:hypothetical protein
MESSYAHANLQGALRKEFSAHFSSHASADACTPNLFTATLQNNFTAKAVALASRFRFAVLNCRSQAVRPRTIQKLVAKIFPGNHVDRELGKAGLSGQGGRCARQRSRPTRDVQLVIASAQAASR